MLKVWVVISRCSGNPEHFCRARVPEISSVAAQRGRSDRDTLMCAGHIGTLCCTGTRACPLQDSTLKTTGGGLCLFVSFPANLALLNDEILMMSKLWPGKSDNVSDLPSKWCDLLYFDSVKQRGFNLVCTKFVSRRKNKSHILVPRCTSTLFIENFWWVDSSFAKLCRKSISIVFWHGIEGHFNRTRNFLEVDHFHWLKWWLRPPQFDCQMKAFQTGPLARSANKGLPWPRCVSHFSRSRKEHFCVFSNLT